MLILIDGDAFQKPILYQCFPYAFGNVLGSKSFRYMKFLLMIASKKERPAGAPSLYATRKFLR